MGATKKHFYPEKQLLFSNLCKALGHPARVSIVEMLSKHNHLNCSDLLKEIHLSQSTISRHCQILHQYGILGYEVIGNNCFYRLDNNVLDTLTDFVHNINVETPSFTGNVYYPENRL